MERKRKIAALAHDLPTFSEPPRYLCVWIDRTPENPHMPSTGVMRWDLRPDDWWTIWPELLAHPCAYLFAPTHPNREGSSSFVGWVASWPVGWDWEKTVPPDLHDHVRKTLATLASPTQTPVSDASGSVVRYAAPERTAMAEPIVPVSQGDMMLQLLVKTLLGVSDAERENTARLLSTLALAPDSARTLDALKTSISKPKEAV